MTYQAWIDAFVKERTACGSSLRGDCQLGAQQMAEAFPELRIARGWCNSLEHWWCVAEDGVILDPTALQFPGETLHYREFKPGDTVHVGKCMNCGNDIYKAVQALDGVRHNICSPECEAAYVRYVMEGP